MRNQISLSQTLFVLALVATPALADTGDQLLKLLTSDGGASSGFGRSIAVSGTTAVIGASSDKDNGHNSGSAYLFDTSTGTQLAKLLPLDPGVGDLFGWSVAISGSRAIVGAKSSDDIGLNSGSAYLFDATTGTQIRKLQPNDSAAGDEFGSSVAISGTAILVGAYRDDDKGSDSGSAYLFDANSGVQIAKFVPLDGKALDRFGDAVALSGTTAIIGAPYDFYNGNTSGSAYLFDTVTGQQIAKLRSPSTGLQGFFGCAVAISDKTAIVGCGYEFVNGTTVSGSAYLFDAATGVRIATLLPLDISNTQGFGGSVAIAGTTALVGASGDDDNGAGSGAAYVFDTTTGIQLAKLLPVDGQANDSFGGAVAVSGTTAIVGAFGDDDNGTDSGSAYTFDATNNAVPATTTVRNGSGVNAILFTKVTDPILGENWETDIDASAHAPSVALVAVFDQPSSGSFLAAGELLVDLSSSLVDSFPLVHAGNVVRLSVLVPFDASLFGVTLSAQAAVLGAPGLDLSNALDLQLGF